MKIIDTVLFCSQINFLKRTKLLKKLCQNPILQPTIAASSMSSQRILELKKALCKSKDYSKKLQWNNLFLHLTFVEVPSDNNFFGFVLVVFLKKKKATF